MKNHNSTFNEDKKFFKGTKSINSEKNKPDSPLSQFINCVNNMNSYRY